MANEVKVTIVAHDGTKKEVAGDTVICFTVSNVEEFFRGKSEIINANDIFVGKDIPDPIFASMIGRLVGSLIETRQKERPVAASSALHVVSKILEEQSKSLASGVSDLEREAELGRAVKEILRAVLYR